MSERVVRSSRNRETGTTILLVDRGPEDEDVLAGYDRWETICDLHGTVCSHGTKRLARSFMAAPTEWCEDCMAQYHTDGGYTAQNPS